MNRYLIRVGALMMALALGTAIHPSTLHAQPADSEEVQSDAHSDADRNRILDTLDDLLEEADDDERLRVIVHMLDGADHNTIVQLENAVGEFTVVSNGGTEDQEGSPWVGLSAFAAVMSKAQVLNLADRPDVKYITTSTKSGVTFSMETAREATGVEVAFSPSILNLTGDLDGNVSNHNANDVVVCMIDTGIQPDHIAFEAGYGYAEQVPDNSDWWKDFVVPLNTAATDQGGHGTAMAGIVVGHDMETDNNDPDFNPETAPHRGVAPGATLGMVRAAASGLEEADLATLIDAVNWCAGEYDDPATLGVVEKLGMPGVDIISGSWGVPVDPTTCTPLQTTELLRGAIQKAIDKNIIAVFAAGNDGPSECTLQVPSNMDGVISVGVVSDPFNTGCIDTLSIRGMQQTKQFNSGGWYLSLHSGRGSRTVPQGNPLVKPDILAPGVCLATSHLQQPQSPAPYATASGTSPATPFVAGVVALMLDVTEKKSRANDPDGLTPAQVLENLTLTAMDSGDWGWPGGFDQDFGAGVIQAREAIMRACTNFHPASQHATKCKSTNSNNVNPDQPDHFTREQALAQGNTQDEWELTVTDTDWPIAITLILDDWPSADFNLQLEDPNQNRVNATSPERQDTLVVPDPQTGTYTLRILNVGLANPSTYWLDVSLGGTLASSPSPDG